jgi:hypothetical protein
MLSISSQLSLFPTALAQSDLRTAWPARVGKVMPAGGPPYRRVMRAALARPIVRRRRCCRKPWVASLCSDLAGLASAFSEPFGEYPNGTPLFRRYGWVEMGAITSLAYRATPYRPSLKARVLALFADPGGPTADVEVEAIVRGRATISARWVSVNDLHPPAQVVA